MAEPQDEEEPPALPPRPADLGEAPWEPQEVPKPELPIYGESIELDADYEELPEPSDCDDGGVADYEELPEPVGDDDGDDYEEILSEPELHGGQSMPCPGGLHVQACAVSKPWHPRGCVSLQGAPPLARAAATGARQGGSECVPAPSHGRSHARPCPASRQVPRPRSTNSCLCPIRGGSQLA